MKFDVVIGNPPYQNGVAAEGRKTATKPLWIDFSELAHGLVAPRGVIAFITPSTWLSMGTASHKAFATFPIYEGVVYAHSTPFKGVATTVSYWLSQENHAGCVISDEVGNSVTIDRRAGFFPCKTKDLIVCLSIFDKTLHATTLKVDAVTTMKYHNEKKHLFSETRTSSFKYPVFHTNTVTKWTTEYDTQLMGVPKVVASKTGSFSQCVVDVDGSVTNLGVAFIASTLECAKVLHAVLKSKLYRFLVESMRHSSTIPTPVYKALPAVDLTRNWTDDELYAHFNLTQEEIDLIESTVK